MADPTQAAIIAALERDGYSSTRNTDAPTGALNRAYRDLVAAGVLISHRVYLTRGEPTGRAPRDHAVRVLAHLRDHVGPTGTTIGTVARELGLHPRQVTAALVVLVEQGVVEAARINRRTYYRPAKGGA